MGGWGKVVLRNSSASDSRSEGWVFESVWPHFSRCESLWASVGVHIFARVRNSAPPRPAEDAQLAQCAILAIYWTGCVGVARGRTFQPETETPRTRMRAQQSSKFRKQGGGRSAARLNFAYSSQVPRKSPMYGWFSKLLSIASARG